MAALKHSKAIRVFEHETILFRDLPEVDWKDALKNYSNQLPNKYFTLLHNGIKFHQYVGVLQIGSWTIEVLPKIDISSSNPGESAQAVLLDMLHYCEEVKIEPLRMANLRLRANGILDYYIHLFLEETNKIINEGLIKDYTRKEGAINVFKGRVLFHKQLQNNWFRKEQVFTNYQAYTFDHPFNLILFQALTCLSKLQLSPEIENRILRLKNQFPFNQIKGLRLPPYEQLSFNLNNKRYEEALKMAYMIIQNFGPDIRYGKNHLMAILFDMNRLFEVYIYKQLLRACKSDFKLQKQVTKVFWNKRKIQPDLVLKTPDTNFVIDTKWKQLPKSQPSIADLKQMFVYSQYFDAHKSVLIYPSLEAQQSFPSIPFAPNSSGQISYCQSIFARLLKNGRLNREIGQELLHQIIQQ